MNWYILHVVCVETIIPEYLFKSEAANPVHQNQKFIWATSWENLFMSYANNKGADRNFKPLPSFCSWARRFESTLVANPEDRFSRDVAHLL